MKILILGGSKFVGRAIAEEAVANGHEVTIFNRGKLSPVKGCTSLVGDRREENGYAALDKLSFDTVIDTWTWEASVVKSAVEALKGRIKQYIFISTISVHDLSDKPSSYDETSKLYELPAPNDYVRDKVGSEAELAASGVPALLLRPGIILGPYENPNGRLTWWLSRMNRGGDTIAPGPKDTELQFIDVRDLAKFAVHGAEASLTGAYILTSPQNHITYEGLLEECNTVTGSKAKLCWLEPELTQEAGLKNWVELPLRLPVSSTSIFNADTTKAKAAGLKIRPVSETVKDTWAWLQVTDVKPTIEAGMILGVDAEKEAAILQKYFGNKA
ncbi:hypothetical protein Golomagni_06409 [Golovinomyces magnicellulatus]|nr:hypothetical protein Golomagni_06409 [Golovinomyces magnicellulatus]